MKIFFWLTLLMLNGFLMNSCGVSKEIEPSADVKIHALPNDLTTLSRADIKAILPMLGDAKLIGVTECVHDMIEPFHFRNVLIKELVEKRRINVIAIESGLPESRLAYDYILGKDIPLDRVYSSGFSCIFGELEPNQELLKWLRDYNTGKTASEQVHFYGFDIPGCAPNPVLENSMAGFNYVLDYLDAVDKENADQFRQSIKDYEIYVRIKDNAEDTMPHFWDLDSTGWNQLESILDELETTFQEHSERYLKNSSELDFNWAFHSIRNARENVIFLRNIGNAEIDIDTRDFGQFKNIQWIMDQEPDRNILLFAHSTHLMKEIHGDTPTLLPYPRCGEYLAEAYGDDYQVIGNFFRKLDWMDGDSLELEEGMLGAELSKIGPPNYFVDASELDKTWNKEWFIRKTNGGDKLLTHLLEAVDIIYFNDTQTPLFVPEGN